jgi:hypothetical protein
MLGNKLIKSIYVFCLVFVFLFHGLALAAPAFVATPDVTPPWGEWGGASYPAEACPEGTVYVPSSLIACWAVPPEGHVAELPPETFIPEGDPSSIDPCRVRMPWEPASDVACQTLPPVAALTMLPPETVPVPEPSIIALFALGIVGIGFARRRRQS